MHPPGRAASPLGFKFRRTQALLPDEPLKWSVHVRTFISFKDKQRKIEFCNVCLEGIYL